MQDTQTLHTQAPTIYNRMFNWFVAMTSISVLYTVSGLLQSDPYILSETALDAMVTFNPIGVWAYISFWVFILLTYLHIDGGTVKALRCCFVSCALLSSIVYLLFPTTMPYPILSEITHHNTSHSNIHEHVWLLIHNVDGILSESQNCMPSLHACLTVLCVWGVFKSKLLFTIRGNRLKFSTVNWVRCLWVLWGSLIIFSVMQTKRHLLIDVITGILLAVIAIGIYWLYCRFFKR